ncbi:arginase family protein [Raoultella terrigena]|uniref:arginase family protein n=1 Tax=Raoultella terrigena TaxID=577 RepID=UPI0030E28BB7
MSTTKMIRLVMPQWQGGNNPAYQFGAELLEWLAPASQCPVVRIPVTPSETPLVNENGIMGRTQVVSQLKAAQAALQAYSPEKVVVLGGDCLVDLAPFAYLAQKYNDSLGVLWIDAHPDVMTPAQFSHSHAHVLGALMGYGDADLTAPVTHPVAANKIMIAGLNQPNDYEKQFIAEKGINTCSPQDVKNGANAVSEWIKREGITCLAIHFDLDVLNYKNFRSVLFANPAAGEHDFDGIGTGQLEIFEVLALINQVDKLTKIVGLGIAEHLPWDAINMKAMLASLPLLRSE